MREAPGKEACWLRKFFFPKAITHIVEHFRGARILFSKALSPGRGKA